MMTSSVLYTAMLTCHPETYSQAIAGIETRVGWPRDGVLSLTYVLRGDVDCVRIPTPEVPRWKDRLWEHTCFEVFLCMNGKPEYCEFNFAPSGEWAAYAFRRYRESVPFVGGELAPEIKVRSAADSLELKAIVPLGHLPGIQPRASLQLALSAVVENNDGKLSYWALKHHPGKPDFHHPDAFALTIEDPHIEAVNESVTDKT